MPYDNTTKTKKKKIKIKLFDMKLVALPNAKLYVIIPSSNVIGSYFISFMHIAQLIHSNGKATKKDVLIGK